MRRIILAQHQSVLESLADQLASREENSRNLSIKLTNRVEVIASVLTIKTAWSKLRSKNANERRDDHNLHNNSHSLLHPSPSSYMLQKLLAKSDTVLNDINEERSTSSETFSWTPRSEPGAWGYRRHSEFLTPSSRSVAVVSNSVVPFTRLHKRSLSVAVLRDASNRLFSPMNTSSITGLAGFSDFDKSPYQRCGGNDGDFTRNSLNCLRTDESYRMIISEFDEDNIGQLREEDDSSEASSGESEIYLENDHCQSDKSRQTSFYNKDWRKQLEVRWADERPQGALSEESTQGILELSSSTDMTKNESTKTSAKNYEECESKYDTQTSKDIQQVRFQAQLEVKQIEERYQLFEIVVAETLQCKEEELECLRRDCGYAKQKLEFMSEQNEEIHFDLLAFKLTNLDIQQQLDELIEQKGAIEEEFLCLRQSNKLEKDMQRRIKRENNQLQVVRRRRLSSSNCKVKASLKNLSISHEELQVKYQKAISEAAVSQAQITAAAEKVFAAEKEQKAIAKDKLRQKQSASNQQVNELMEKLSDEVSAIVHGELEWLTFNVEIWKTKVEAEVEQAISQAQLALDQAVRYLEELDNQKDGWVRKEEELKREVSMLKARSTLTQLELCSSKRLLEEGQIKAVNDSKDLAFVQDELALMRMDLLRLKQSESVKHIQQKYEDEQKQKEEWAQLKLWKADVDSIRSEWGTLKASADAGEIMKSECSRLKQCIYDAELVGRRYEEVLQEKEIQLVKIQRKMHEERETLLVQLSVVRDELQSKKLQCLNLQKQCEDSLVAEQRNYVEATSLKNELLAYQGQINRMEVASEVQKREFFEKQRKLCQIKLVQENKKKEIANKQLESLNNSLKQLENKWTEENKKVATAQIQIKLLQDQRLSLLEQVSVLRGICEEERMKVEAKSEEMSKQIQKSQQERTQLSVSISLLQEKLEEMTIERDQLMERATLEMTLFNQERLVLEQRITKSTNESLKQSLLQTRNEICVSFFDILSYFLRETHQNIQQFNSGSYIADQHKAAYKRAHARITNITTLFNERSLEIQQKSEKETSINLQIVESLEMFGVIAELQREVHKIVLEMQAQIIKYTLQTPHITHQF